MLLQDDSVERASISLFILIPNLLLQVMFLQSYKQFSTFSSCPPFRGIAPCRCTEFICAINVTAMHPAPTNMAMDGGVSFLNEDKTIPTVSLISIKPDSSSLI
jgi:hypothetical protein